MSRPARWLAWRSIALALVLTSAISARAGAADDLYKQLGALFVTAVHRDSELSAPLKKLSRWTVPLRVAVAGRQFAEWQPRIRPFLAELADATGRDIEMVTEVPVNVAVLFADGFAADSDRVPVFKALLQNVLNDQSFVAEMAEADRKGVPCIWAVVRHNTVVNSAILLVAERAPRRAQDLCVFPWLVGAAGVTLWGIDRRMIAGKLLDESTEGTIRLSTTGRQLLRVIYDPRLQEGMHVDETLPLLRDIVGGLR